MTGTFGLTVGCPLWQLACLAVGDLSLFLYGAVAWVKALHVFAYITLIAWTARRNGIYLGLSALLTALTGAIYAVDSALCTSVLRRLHPELPWHVLVEVGGLAVMVTVNEAL